jgi:peptidoglycan/LPS O-acetylase OafA/YrhL
MKKRYSFISLLRVLAMISIVAGHLCSYFNIYLYDLGGVGVEIFLAISGYLYGRRIIEDKREWIKSRALRIMIPVWIWTVFLFILGCVIDEPHFDLLPCLIGIQGACFITPWNPPIYPAMSHTWFITAILVCYLITIALCSKKGHSVVDKYKWIIFAASCVAQIILARFGFQIAYFIIFFFGFVIARLDQKHIGRRAVLSFAAMIALGVTRILLHGLENWFYNSVVALWSAGAIGVFSLCFFEWSETKRVTFFENIAKSILWKYLDIVSYSVYIAHYCYLHGFFSVDHLIESKPMQLLLMLLFTIISAIALERLTALIDNKRALTA